MARQEVFWFSFDEKKAFALVNNLKSRRGEIDEITRSISSNIRRKRFSEKTGKQLKTKVTNLIQLQENKLERLKAKYPEIRFAHTQKGNVKLDDDVLDKLGKKYPEANYYLNIRC